VISGEPLHSPFRFTSQVSFSFFVLFNLYCPNETNDSRLPYKMNYLHTLSARVSALVAQGRNVIVLGDINVCAEPIDNGEGGIQRMAEEHFAHPARQWLEQWKKDGMHDVTRERWPERKGMFTCELQRRNAESGEWAGLVTTPVDGQASRLIAPAMPLYPEEQCNPEANRSCF
jgi:AP endonuclease-2